MSKVDNGGPAFPRPASRYSEQEISLEQDGMDLRDYFAAKAMHAMFQGFGPGEHTAPDIYFVCAREAYSVADAMIAARKK